MILEHGSCINFIGRGHSPPQKCPHFTHQPQVGSIQATLTSEELATKSGVLTN